MKCFNKSIFFFHVGHLREGVYTAVSMTDGVLIGLNSCMNRDNTSAREQLVDEPRKETNNVGQREFRLV